MGAHEDGPGAVIPNSIHWLLLVAAVGLTLVSPVRFLPSAALGFVVGSLLVAVGVSMWWWGRSTLRGEGGTPGLDEVSETLVRSGPYRISRNPMYLGLALGFVGISSLANSVWLLAFAAIEFVLADVQVRGEEDHLEAVFGETYVNYRSQVRRWL